MKLHLNKKLCLATTVIAICFSQQAAATRIQDNYIGASSLKKNGSYYGDVIGSRKNFQINYMDVALNGSILSVSIDTTFGGKAEKHLFRNATRNNKGIGYGDLFLSSTWKPFGSSPYKEDDNSNGTIWGYGFSLNNRWGKKNLTHNGTLYKLNSHNNNADAYLSNDFISVSTYDYRNGQEVAVDTKKGNITKKNKGTWNTTLGVNGEPGTVNFKIDLSGTELLHSNKIALHWGMTCGNDVIEGAYSVPEPGVLILMTIGLAGFGFAAAKKRKMQQS